jgi:hypothetical protein
VLIGCMRLFCCPVSTVGFWGFCPRQQAEVDRWQCGPDVALLRGQLTSVLLLVLTGSCCLPCIDSECSAPTGSHSSSSVSSLSRSSIFTAFHFSVPTPWLRKSQDIYCRPFVIIPAGISLTDISQGVPFLRITVVIITIFLSRL